MMHTRAFCLLGLLCHFTAWAQTLPLHTGDESVDFAKVKSLSSERALRPFVSRRAEWAPFWSDLSAHDHEKISFQRQQALWAADQRPFFIEFLHPGGAYRETTLLAEIIKGHSHDLAWSAAAFDYDELSVPDGTPAAPGYAGFKALMPLESPTSLDDWALFDAANSFRSTAPGMTFGVSARGLVVNPTAPTGEELPTWQRFWLEQPAENAKALQFFSLLEGPSVCGAYRFRLAPGRSTVMEVESELTFRQIPTLLGLAPLASMCWYGKLTQPKPQDYHPEVHHSDGLLVHPAEGEAIWFPLDSGKTLRHTEIPVESLVGFGLIQRERQFSAYQDLQARYHERPSAYIEPVGTWSSGKIHLFEQPATDGMTDNVLVCWEPATPPKVGQPYPLGYRIHWLNEMSVPGICKVLASRRSQTSFLPEEKRADTVQFCVDFSQTATIIDDPQQIILYTEVTEGAKLQDKQVEKNPETGGWRATFRVKVPTGIDAFTAHCHLLVEGRPVSERWTYQWKR